MLPLLQPCTRSRVPIWVSFFLLLGETANDLGLFANRARLVAHFPGGHFLQTTINLYTQTREVAIAHAVETAAASSSSEASNTEDPGKKPLNLLTLVSELYNFQVVGCLLVYDLIKGFIEDLGVSGKGDFAVEAILRILRSRSLAVDLWTGGNGKERMPRYLTVPWFVLCGLGCGQQLRSDDPTALKDIVALVQEKTAGQESTLS